MYWTWWSFVLRTYTCAVRRTKKQRTIPLCVGHYLTSKVCWRSLRNISMWWYHLFKDSCCAVVFGPKWKLTHLGLRIWVDLRIFSCVQLLSNQIYDSGYDLAWPLQCTSGLIHENLSSRKKTITINKWAKKIECNPEKLRRGDKLKMRINYLMSTRPLSCYMCSDYALMAFLVDSFCLSTKMIYS